MATAAVPDRLPGSSTWEISSGSCAATGAPVKSGDIIYLRNLYEGNGGYLDVNGAPTAAQKQAGGLYDVTTAWGKDRDGNSSRWQIFDQTTSPLDGLVRFNDTVLLWSTYKNLGGFLDVSYASPLPAARLDVDTNAYANRSNSNVTFWKILPTT